MTQKIAIYARYSSDNQRDASIADQLRICQLFAKRQEWRVTNEYSDHALSGASLLRPGIQALIADALAGRFSIVLTEALDRLSRDQEDIAGLYKRMSFAGVKIVTISEGEISALHVGLKGTMNALFLKDLADKTRRGLRGRVEQGRSAGGNSYGYAVTGRGTDSARGERCINEKEAVIVRRIFEEYCSGKSPKKIAHDLNREGIPGPLGRHWGFSTINGSAKRGNGILNNELYIGRIVWNRQSFVKDPDTGRRQARLNPQSEWITHDVPGLRIVSDDLWHAAKRRQQRPEKQNAIEEPHFRDWRRPRYILSGLTKCGCCGGGYSMISSAMLGCSTARNKGTCDNKLNIRRDQLESRVLKAIRYQLMNPSLFKEFCEEFTRETNRLRSQARVAMERGRAEIRKIDRELEMLVELILQGGAAAQINKKMVALEKQKEELEAKLGQAKDPPPNLHPEMASFYRKQIDELYASLSDETEATRMKAVEAIRSLIGEIVLQPEGETLAIEVKGDLAGILSIAAGRKIAPKFPKPGRKSEEAPVEEIISQVEMVAGAGFEPAAFRL